MGSNTNPQIVNLFNIYKKELTAFFVASAFAIIFSIFSILQYYSLGTSAYDLGINSQVLWSFLHTRSFYTPLLNENILAQHFVIFKFLQIPLYYFFPSPIALMVFEDIFISMAGFIVYLLSMKLLKDHIKSSKILFVISIGFLLSYEFSPYTESLVSFPFHNMAFLPFFFLLAFYAFLMEKRILHIISILFIISIHANFVYIAIILLFYEFLFLHTLRGKRINIWFSSKSNPRGMLNFSYFILSILLLYGYLILAGTLKLHFAGISSVSPLPTTGETGTPVSSPIALLLLLFEKPMTFTSIIESNSAGKIFYLNFLFKSIIYLPFFSPLSLLLTLPYILYAMPSSYSAYYQLGYQYSALITGAIYLSAIMGTYNILRILKYVNNHYKVSIKKLSRIYVRKLKNEKFGIALISIVIVLVLTISIPYGILSPPSLESGSHRYIMNDIYKEKSNNASAFLINLSSQIPANSFILTQNTLMPYFSNHCHVYSTPWSPGYYHNISKFQFIIIQNNSLWARIGGNYSLQNIYNKEIENGHFIIYKRDVSENIIVLKSTN
jgi:uncharacterized membrane protein